jgi:hypothetical protein
LDATQQDSGYTFVYRKYLIYLRFAHPLLPVLRFSSLALVGGDADSPELDCCLNPQPFTLTSKNFSVM